MCNIFTMLTQIAWITIKTFNERWILSYMWVLMTWTRSYHQNIAESMVSLAMNLNIELIDVSISSIILKTWGEVNVNFKALCSEKNIYLIDKTKKIKSHNINKGTLRCRINQGNAYWFFDFFPTPPPLLTEFIRIPPHPQFSNFQGMMKCKIFFCI